MTSLDDETSLDFAGAGAPRDTRRRHARLHAPGALPSPPAGAIGGAFALPQRIVRSHDRCRHDSYGARPRSGGRIRRARDHRPKWSIGCCAPMPGPWRIDEARDACQPPEFTRDNTRSGARRAGGLRGIIQGRPPITTSPRLVDGHDPRCATRFWMVTGAKPGSAPATRVLAAQSGYRSCVNCRQDREAADRVAFTRFGRWGRRLAVVAEWTSTRGRMRCFEAVTRLGPLAALRQPMPAFSRRQGRSTRPMPNRRTAFQTKVIAPFLCAQKL